MRQVLHTQAQAQRTGPAPPDVSGAVLAVNAVRRPGQAQRTRRLGRYCVQLGVNPAKAGSRGWWEMALAEGSRYHETARHSPRAEGLESPSAPLESKGGGKLGEAGLAGVLGNDACRKHQVTTKKPGAGPGFFVVTWCREEETALQAGTKL